MSLLLNLLGPPAGFDGGLFLPDYKALLARRPIETLRAECTLQVPLRHRRDFATVAEVRPGQRVLRGQTLARPADDRAAAIAAPTSGTIVEIGNAWTPLDGAVPCAVLEPDGQDEWTPRPATWEGDSFIAQITDRGVPCTNPRAPAQWVIREAIAAGVTDLIVNGMETESYLTADLRTLVEEPGRIVDATGEIADAMGVSRTIIALPYRHRRVAKQITAETAGRSIEISQLSHRYPQCHPAVLAKTIIDREVPPGGSTLDVQALVLPLSTVRACAVALLDCRAITQTVLTVAGDAVQRPGTYRVAIGTPLPWLLKRVGLKGPVAQAVWGGPLTGVALGREDIVITADTTAILLFSNVEEHRPVPCIHCGWCVEDCPVGVDPIALIQLEADPSCDAQSIEQLRACIDCGLCSYVCPAELPLAASIRGSRLRFVPTNIGKQAVGAT